MTEKETKKSGFVTVCPIPSCSERISVPSELVEKNHDILWERVQRHLECYHSQQEIMKALYKKTVGWDFLIGELWENKEDWGIA